VPVCGVLKGNSRPHLTESDVTSRITYEQLYQLNIESDVTSRITYEQLYQLNIAKSFCCACLLL
jgi:hypothetical protein